MRLHGLDARSASLEEAFLDIAKTRHAPRDQDPRQVPDRSTRSGGTKKVTA